MTHIKGQTIIKKINLHHFIQEIQDLNQNIHCDLTLKIVTDPNLKLITSILINPNPMKDITNFKIIKPIKNLTKIFILKTILYINASMIIIENSQR